MEGEYPYGVVNRFGNVQFHAERSEVKMLQYRNRKIWRTQNIETCMLWQTTRVKKKPNIQKKVQGLSGLSCLRRGF